MFKDKKEDDLLMANPWILSDIELWKDIMRQKILKVKGGTRSWEWKTKLLPLSFAERVIIL